MFGGTLNLTQSINQSVITTTGRRVKLYRQHMSQAKQALLISDVLLIKAMERQLDEYTETTVSEDGSDDPGDDNYSSSMDTTLLVTTLELVALEKLTISRQPIVRELHSEQFPLVNEFEVLYAYKCGFFEECMELCRKSIGRPTLLKPGGLSNQTYCTASPEMLCLLDGELVSVYGVIRLLRPALFAEFHYYLQIDILTLLLYLLVRCQTNLRSDSPHDTMKLIRYVHNEVFLSYSEVNTTVHNFLYFDRLVLKLSYRLLKLYIKTRTDLQ